MWKLVIELNERHNAKLMAYAVLGVTLCFGSRCAEEVKVCLSSVV